MIVQRHHDTDRSRDDRIHDPVVNTPSDVIPLKREDLVFGDLHPSWLAVSYEHLNIGFEAAELLQNLSLKVLVDNVNHKGNTRDVVA